jgi:excisionase family DNA binding protein
MNGLLKPADVQALLNVSRRLIYQMAADGRLPAVRVGGPDGPLRFKADVIESLVDEWER